MRADPTSPAARRAPPWTSRRAAFRAGLTDGEAHARGRPAPHGPVLLSFRQAPLRRLLLRRVLSRVPGAAVVLGSRDGAYWRGVRRGAGSEVWRGLTAGTLILMYHAFAERDADAAPYVVTARSLERQLWLLRRLGRRVIPLDEYVRGRLANRPPPPRSVVITIDDGYADVVELAAPVLARRGAPATVFVVSGRVGAANDWDPGEALHGRPLAGWTALRSAAAHGLAVGAHSHTHPHLTRLGAEEAMAELSESRRVLEEGLGRPAEDFAFPYGDEDRSTTELVARAGFRSACTSRGGINAAGEPLLALRRVEVRGHEPLWRFALIVLLGRRRLRARR